MATHEIDVARQKAGAEYLTSLEHFGLRPDALFWAFDKTLDRFVLVLVTEAVDFAGPFNLSKVLMEAHRKAATPIEIDPFIVRVHSPNQAIIKALGSVLPFSASKARVHSPDGELKDNLSIAEMITNAADLEVSSEWVYRFEKKKKTQTIEVARHWRRFATNIEKLAA
jgi:hypothetical protein